MEEAPDFCSLCRICGLANDAKLDLFNTEIVSKLQILRFQLSTDEGLPSKVCIGCFDKLTEMHNFVTAMQRTDESLRTMLEASKQSKLTLPDFEEVGFTFLDSEPASPYPDPASPEMCDSYESSPEKPKKRKSSDSPSKTSKRLKRESICTKLSEMESKMKETEQINASLNLQAVASTSSSDCASILELITKNQSKPRQRIQLDSSQTSICICDKCNIMFSSGALLEQHRADHVTFQCQICAANFNTPLILASHLKRNVHKIAAQDTKWTCAECFLVSKDKGSMLEHVRSVHTKERPFECSLCDRKFAVKRALTLHVREHKQDWSHVCNYCGKGFLIKEYCEIHIRRYHTNEKPFECDRCDAKYPSKLQLSEHKISKHEGGRPEQIFSCHVCGKKFKGTTSYKYHVRTHELPLESRKKFKCGDCNAAFIRKPALIKHMKRHRGEYDEFECHLCGKKLATSHGLELHLVVHSGEKNHVCEFCGKAFAAAGTLKVHIRSHTGEKPYLCKFCPKRFTQRSSIKMHMKNLHHYDDSDKSNNFPVS
jgi:Zinc-finger associated domain (zf-AD)/Zinc finger, C2H2 type